MSEVDLVVVGAGLAGLVAALAAHDAAAAAGFALTILVLEKQPSTGGNSAKASSGMNAAVTPVQSKLNVGDSIEAFYEDTIASGDGLSDVDLVLSLTSDSLSAWEFLASYGIDLSKISKCGGHSFARTHRQDDSKLPKPTNVGYYITSTLAKVLLERKDVSVKTNAKVMSLLTRDGKVNGIKFVLKDSGDSHEVFCKAVILATGGYGGDFSESSYLKKHHPLAWSLASTNGPFAAGEGITIAKEVGAGTIHMDKVQIHPTGFIDPKNEFDKTKFLAPEALRGHGGILLNQRGQRFVNELGRRDHVTQAIFENCEKEYDEEKKNSQHVCFLVLNEESKNAYGPGFGFYIFKGFFKEYDNLDAFRFALKISKCDESVSLPLPFSEVEKIFVAKITPSVHYTMGGLMISENAEILTEANEVVQGLFGAGEVTGGVHGENRLAGNSLLECVVFGRIAATSAINTVRKQHSSKI